MMVKVAAAALPMPRARCPAARPMLTTMYQRDVVRASSARLRTSRTPSCRAVSKPNVGVEPGKRQIVVDGLGHVGHADGPCRLAMDLAGRECRVVAADGHQVVDAQALEDFQDVVHVFGRLGGVGARGAQDRAAAVMDILDIVDGQLAQHGGIALDEPLEAVGHAEDFDAVVDRFDGHGADDAVDSRRGAAADQQCHLRDSCSVAHTIDLPWAPRLHFAACALKLKIVVSWGDFQWQLRSHLPVSTSCLRRASSARLISSTLTRGTPATPPSGARADLASNSSITSDSRVSSRLPTLASTRPRPA